MNSNEAVIQINSAVPTLLASDVAATARWYVDHFGFRIAGHVPNHEPYVYANVQHGAAEIMLLSLSNYRRPDITSLRPEGLWDVYLRMDGVRTLYQNVRNEPFIKMPLKKQPYGDWEFEVWDPNGYILTFGGDAHIADGD
jgi:uncharacterized glyoxalase superfamily protein PhnB